MKKIIYTTSLILLLAFKADDIVELESALNARTSMNFNRDAGNIRTTLSKGTSGRISEYKKLPSGNYGLKLKILNGPFKDQSYWVYYNNNGPALKLLDDKSQPIPEKKEPIAASLKKAETAVAKRDIASVRDPEEHAVSETLKNVEKINNGELSKTLEMTKSPCPPTLTETSKEANYQVGDLSYPFRETPSLGMNCSDKNMDSKIAHASNGDRGYDLCYDSKGIPQAFSVRNSGGNPIVTKNEYQIARSFDFQYTDRARSDMRLIISDQPDDTSSHAHWSVMTFLPRNVLPSIKKIGEELEVTLPTNEKIKFNAKTREIMGGVMTEGPMAQDDRGRAKPAAVNYTGSGVVIRADKIGDLPIGDIEKKDGTTAPSVSVATISKKGQKDCKVPARDIWYTNNDLGGEALVKKELVTDAGFNDFIVKKCGFSIY